ncbi:MAG: MFS transporter [Clostridia bacterium]|nr:MFS transporter [Clostridia bacterium]
MQKDKRKFDYKWVIVGLCFLMIMLVLGFASSAKSIYIKPQTEYLGLKRTLFSIGDSLRYLTTAILSVFFGYLIEKFGAKKLIVTGLISIFLALICYAMATNLVLIYIGGILLGVGFGWTTTTMVGYVVNVWSKENKGTIMGVILCANGVGGAVAVQILTPVINASATGYKTSYFIVATIVAVIALLMIVFFKNRPKKIEANFKPVKIKTRISKDDWEGIDFKTVIKRPYFYVFCFCVFATGMLLQGATSMYTPMMYDRGLDANIISLTLTASMLFLAFFKIVTGKIFDRFGLRTSVTICMVCAVMAMTILCFIDNSIMGTVLAFIYAFIVGIGTPLTTIMLPLYALGLFGQSSYNKLLGIVVTLNTAGNTLGEPFMNLFFDLMGDYKLGLYITVAFMTLVAILIQYVIVAARKDRAKIENKNNLASNCNLEKL